MAPEYGSMIERIATESSGAAQARSLETSNIVRKILKQTGMRAPISSPSMMPTNKPLKNGPPVGMNGMPFIKEVMDPLKNFTITSPFGYRTNPVTGEHSLHTGIDLAAPEGTPIRASANGYVRRAHWEDIDGRMILVGHGKGWKTSYSHLSKILVKRGQYVKRGQIIGYVGSTGRSTGPHLHWQVYRKGDPINPRRFL